MSNRSKAVLRIVVSAVSIAVIFCTMSYAVTADRIASTLSGGPTVALRGKTHHQALPRFDQGPVDPSMRLGSITLLTTPAASQLKALKQLVAEQQDPKSPNYHKWLTSEQWADRFGLSRGDLQKISNWLTSQGFEIGYVARGRNYITFSGTAAQVESAFGTQIHRFKVNGEMHVANTSVPKIPAALSGIVVAVRGLDDFSLKPSAIKAHPNYYDGNLATTNYLAPGDIATEYDLKGLYTNSIDGTGQRLAIIGQTDIFIGDINDFRSAFGLSSINTCTSDMTSGLVTACNDPNFQYVLVLPSGTTDPLAPSLNDIVEADLDLEWAGAVAHNAQIVYVNSPVQVTGAGIREAWYYAVDQNIAPVISLSYGLCEFHYSYDISSSDEVELQKANTQGITFVTSSGDSGAAECDPNGVDTSGGSATGGYTVQYPASSPEVTAVGGTAVPLVDYTGANAPTYWGKSNGSDGTSVLTPIPEQAWNDDDEFAQDCATTPTQFCQQGGATPFPGWVPVTSPQTAQFDLSLGTANGIRSSGGGPSDCAVQDPNFTTCMKGFSQPTWQNFTLTGTGITAAARFTPDVSLLASPNYPGFILCTPQEAWVSSSTSTSSTCANGISAGALETYTSVAGGTSVSAPMFAGIITLLNQYLAGPASAGLGNINPMLYQLAAVPSNTTFRQVTTGDNNVACTASTGSSGVTACPASAPLIVGFAASSPVDTTTGYNLVTGLGSVDAANLLTAWATAFPNYSLAATAPASVAAGSSTTSTVTLTVSNTLFKGTVTFGCSGLPTGATCSFTPTTATTSGTSTLTIATSASTPAATSNVTITGTSGAVSYGTAVSLTVTASTPTITLSPSTPSFSVSQGSAVDATIALTVAGGITVHFTCSDPASESICTPPPDTKTSGNVSFHITTTAATASLNRPFDRDSRIFYAVLLPGLFGIMLTLGSRKRSLRGMRMLGLTMVLGVSTIWLGSCGGSSNKSTGNPGTPKGTYQITVTGTQVGGSTTGSSNFNLVVQ